MYNYPAAFGRLCVETLRTNIKPLKSTSAAFGRLCVETCAAFAMVCPCAPAAFGRLCVETGYPTRVGGWLGQPPSGGCVLKPWYHAAAYRHDVQPPSGGCVLKLLLELLNLTGLLQPPSGGCVLKPDAGFNTETYPMAAAFGRLCVETHGQGLGRDELPQPPSGGCVLKQLINKSKECL